MILLILVEEIFSRSKYFRALMGEGFKDFAENFLGINRALPPPQQFATLLRTRALETFEKWNQQHGKHERKVNENGLDSS
jgi:hypothetical protein